MKRVHMVLFAVVIGGAAMGQIEKNPSEVVASANDIKWGYREKAGGIIITSVPKTISGDVVIPEVLDGKEVHEIGGSAFRDCVAITSVKIPSAVTRIESSAFSRCTGLKSILLPSRLKSINCSAFSKCSSLVSIKIPSGVSGISSDCFNECRSLSSLKISNGVKWIGSGAFYGCNSLSTVIIPASVTNISGNAFWGCSGLKSFSVDSGNINYCSKNGMLCTKNGEVLVCGVNGEVKVPKGVKEIGRLAFCNFTNLCSVSIPYGVTNIDRCAFAGCKNLTSMTMPATVVRIDCTAFVNGTYPKDFKIVDASGEKCESFEKYCKRMKIACQPMRRLLGENSPSTINAKASVAAKLQHCQYLLNGDIKKNAKVYLCLFSASWCGPCRREMPRIAKMYAETLKDDPDVELIHFSRDQNDEKALAWAKEHDVKFPVVKPNGGNPLELKCSGIPHLFIVKADGTLIEEGHPAGILSEEKIQKLKTNGFKPIARKSNTGNVDLREGELTDTVDGYTWTYRVDKGSAMLVAAGGKRRCTVLPSPKGDITIPSRLGGLDVTKIGSEAFCECSGVTSVTIPEGVKEICWRAFGECGSLKSIKVPASVTRIYSSAFSSCKSLTHISVDDKNNNYVVRDGVVFEKDLKTLICCPGGLAGEYAIPAGVTRIYDSAFSGCAELTSVVVSDDVTQIGEWAFSHCTALSTVQIGSGVTRISQGPFYRSRRLKSIFVSERNPRYASVDGILFDKKLETLICCPGGFTGNYEIPIGTKSLGRFAFHDCQGLTAVTIPSTVTSVGGDAFGCCGGLTSLMIPSSVKTMGRWAFSPCYNLKEIEISQGVPAIGEHAFCNCSKLETLIIPSSVTSIGESAFWGCNVLSSIKMCGECPKSGERIFDRCTKLSAIHVPANAKSWAGMKEWQGIPLVFDVAIDTDSKTAAAAVKGESMKSSQRGELPSDGTIEIDGITWSYKVIDSSVMIVSPTGKLYECAVSPKPSGSVVVPSFIHGLPVTKIGEFALCECPDIVSIKIPGSVRSIGAWAFSGCRKLSNIIIPAMVDNIEECAFANCPKLLKIGLERGNRKYIAIDGVLYTKDMKTLVTGPGGVASVIIPDGVTEIGREAFRCCRELKSVAIPSSVTTIRPEAFLASGLESVEIPANVSRIGDWSFWCCTRLRTLTICEGVSTIGSQAFYQCTTMKEVSIPASVSLIESSAFNDCRELSSVIFLGERPETKGRIFDKCEKLAAIHVPEGAKSWQGMKKWQGIPLVFDAGEKASSTEMATIAQKPMMIEADNVEIGHCNVAKKLNGCKFLVSGEFKKNAKVYLCLFSASWCGPCRREMPRIAKMYAETLKDDPDIELIHFSCDRDEEKALAWAKEHDVKFPVVKPKGGNPLELHSRGIPHLFIVKADGTVVEDGHPMKLFTEEKIKAIKAGDFSAGGEKTSASTCEANDCSLRKETPDEKDALAEDEHREKVGDYTWTYAVENGKAIIRSKNDKRFPRFKCAVSPRLTGDVTIPAVLGGVPVTRIEAEALKCGGVTSLTIPASLVSIDKRALDFRGRMNRFVVDEANLAYTAKNGMLCSKDGKTLVFGVNGSPEIPEGVTRIGECAFFGCLELEKIVIPTSVTRIDSGAFFHCHHLKSIDVSKSVTDIANGAFGFCTELEAFVVHPDNPVFSSRNRLLCSKDGTRLLAGVNGDVEIPSGVTSIDGGVFSGRTGLKSLTIPASVTEISGHAFSCCQGIVSVKMLGERPEVKMMGYRQSESLFRCNRDLMAIHVPKNAKSWENMKEWQGITLVFDVDQ